MNRYIASAEAQADIPKPQAKPDLPPMEDAELPPIRGRVYFLEGCAMEVLFSRVHACAKRLLRRVGYEVQAVQQGCCGALHTHNGHLEHARTLARQLVQSLDQNLPIIVDSAGCGSTMKEYSSLLHADPPAVHFASRVFDLSEFLAKEGLADQLAKSPGIDLSVAYHEACHLVHGQKISAAPKNLLSSVPRLNLVNLPEAEMCCGSAGIYNLTQPEMARKLLDRKWSNIETAKPQLVVTGNPGCHSWIAQAAREHGNEISVLHTAELLEASFIGLRGFIGL